MISQLAAPLRKALRQLEAEKKPIERQIAMLQTALADLGAGNVRRRPRSPARPKARRRMSAAARRAISQRMKASWAKRKAAMAKGTEKKAQKGG